MSNYLARRKQTSEQRALLLLLLLLGLGSLLVLTVIAVAAGAVDIAAGDQTPVPTPLSAFTPTSTSTDSPTPSRTPSKTPTETPTDTPAPTETATPVPMVIESFGVDFDVDGEIFDCLASVRWNVSGEPKGEVVLYRYDADPDVATVNKREGLDLQGDLTEGLPFGAYIWQLVATNSANHTAISRPLWYRCFGVD